MPLFRRFPRISSYCVALLFIFFNPFERLPVYALHAEVQMEEPLFAARSISFPSVHR